MIVSGVVCEYNPFHKGHKYMLDRMRNDGTSHILCIMSGNFVQRGETAICNKHLRAEMAVRNGADLVVELPVPYALGTAETFARGSVGILNSLNCVDRLCFGSENNISELSETLDFSETDEFRKALKAGLDEGLSYPAAFSAATSNRVAEGPNNVLALEYMKQLRRLNSSIEPVEILRVGAGHDSNEERDGFLSASAIRNKLWAGEDITAYVPDDVAEMLEKGLKNGELPSDTGRCEIAIMSVLRSMSEKELSGIADVNEGLEFRLYKAISQGTSLDEISELVKTKRYTSAKIRRIIMCAWLGITKEMQTRLPGYINVLACNKKGLEIIRMIKEASDIRIVTRYGDYDQLKEADKTLYDFSDKCDGLYGLTTPEIMKLNYNRTRRFTVL